MKLEGYKQIAAYISKHARDTSERTARRYASGSIDPLPVKVFGGTAVAQSEDVDRWIARRWKPVGGKMAASGRR